MKRKIRNSITGLIGVAALASPSYADFGMGVQVPMKEDDEKVHSQLQVISPNYFQSSAQGTLKLRTWNWFTGFNFFYPSNDFNVQAGRFAHLDNGSALGTMAVTNSSIGAHGLFTRNGNPSLDAHVNAYRNVGNPIWKIAGDVTVGYRKGFMQAGLEVNGTVNPNGSTYDFGPIARVYHGTKHATFTYKPRQGKLYIGLRWNLF